MNPTRLQVVEALDFADGFARADLLDPNSTSTWVVAGMQWMIAHVRQRIFVTAVRHDHPTYDGGPSGNGHNGGKAIDYTTKADPGDPSYSTDQEALVIATAHCPFWWTVCLGGSFQHFKSYVTWPRFPFVYCDDNNQPHIHAQCQNVQGGPGARAA